MDDETYYRDRAEAEARIRHQELRNACLQPADDARLFPSGSVDAA